MSEEHLFSDKTTKLCNFVVIPAILLWVAVFALGRRSDSWAYFPAWEALVILPLQTLLYFFIGKIIYLAVRRMFVRKSIRSGPWLKLDWFSILIVVIGLIAASLVVKFRINPVEGSVVDERIAKSPLAPILLYMTAIPWIIILIGGYFIAYLSAGLSIFIIISWFLIHATNASTKFIKPRDDKKVLQQMPEKEQQVYPENKTWESVKQITLSRLRSHLNP